MMTKATKSAAGSAGEEHPYSKPAPQEEDTTVLTSHKPMEWSENFQDLSIFCNFGSKMVDNNNTALQLGEQLDTPIITVNDEFDFGLRSSSRVSHETLDDSDPWDLNIQQQQQQQQHQPPTNPQSQSSSNNNNNNVKQWETVTYWLSSSPQHNDIDYEPPTSAFTDEKLNVVEPSFADSTKLGDFVVEEDQHHKLNDDSVDKIAENKEQAIDIVELLKSNNNNSNRPPQYSQLFGGNGYDKVTVIGNSSTSNNSRKVLRNSLLMRNSSSNKNSRDLLSDSLSSIFKAEEPLVNDQRPSLLGAKNLNRPQLVLPKQGVEVIEIGSASPTQKKDELIFNADPDFVIPDIKMEPEDVCEEEEVEPMPSRSFKAPVKQVKKLKLDIKSANILGAGAVLTPTTAVLGESLDTPDVLKPLLEGMDNPSFDLIKYCEADELAGLTFPNGGASPPVVESRKTIPTVNKQVKYGQKKEDTYEAEREVLSTIKEEDINTDESSSFQQICAASAKSKVMPRKKITPQSRKRRRPNFANFDSENSSDNYVDNEDEDETFHLPPKSKCASTSKSKRQRMSSKTSTVSSGKRTVSSSGIDSDQESIISLERYRELRDRNNEASKRSRMNRKSREMEMKEMAIEMENRNNYLKARADKLVKLVETFRKVMFKLVAKKD